MGQDRTVALVTGASEGVGAAICAALARDGVQPVGLDIQPAIADWPGYLCDLKDLAALEVAIDRVEREVGPIGILVNNAALYQPLSWLDLSPQQWDASMAVNARAVLFASQFVARRMIAAGRGGAIVNIASLSGQVGSAALDYAASKAAVIAITTSLGKALAPHGIRVNAIAPAGIRTEMSARMVAATREALIAGTPMKRLAEPDEIAQVVVFLASEKSSYMTGATVDVNGGF